MALRKNGKFLVFSIVLLSVVLMHHGSASAQARDCSHPFHTGAADAAAATQGSNPLLSTTSTTIAPSSTTSEASSSTSGTSGCGEDPKNIVDRERMTLQFIAGMGPALQQQMAQGGGPDMQTLATLLGCGESARPILFLRLQDQFASIVPTEPTPGAKVFANVKTLIQAEPRLRLGCVISA
jgi:hypothetical protein